MRKWIKKIMMQVGLYHPLQSRYQAFLSAVKRRKNKRDYIGYKGGGFSCNVCGEQYRKFVPSYPKAQNHKALSNNNVIAGYGDNIYCPNCMSTARERLIIAVLKKEFSLSGKKILHLSPEKNVFNYINMEADVVTADLEPGYYKMIDHNIIYQDLNRLDFKNDSFDLVIGNHIMEHIPSDKKAMEEIVRVLKPGGQAILQIPYSETISSTIESNSINSPGQQSRLYGQKDHVRIYSLKDYVNRLESAGFIVHPRPYSQLSQYLIYAIQEGECFLEIKKPLFFK